MVALAGDGVRPLRVAPTRATAATPMAERRHDATARPAAGDRSTRDMYVPSSALRVTPYSATATLVSDEQAGPGKPFVARIALWQGLPYGT
jgi:hypothetical protein